MRISAWSSDVCSSDLATRAAAAAPNRMTMGGAGTGTPPVDVLVEPPLDVDELVLLEVEVEELVLLDVEELVLLDVLVPPPKLLELDVDETLPLEVEVLVEPPDRKSTRLNSSH